MGYKFFLSDERYGIQVAFRLSLWYAWFMGNSAHVTGGTIIMPRNEVCKKTVDENGIVFHFADGTELAVDVDELPVNIQRKGLVHGISSKLGDSYAGCGGHVPTAIEAFKSVLVGLQNDQWNTGRTGDGGIIVEAFANATGQNVEAARIKWGELSDKEKAAVKSHPKVKLAKASIELERAREKAEGATLDLDGLV